MGSFKVSAKARRNLSVAAISAIAIVGVASLVFKTYPHLKPACLGGKDDEESPHADDVAPTTPVSDSAVIVDSEYNEWTDDKLSEYLKEKDVTVPENAGHAELVALVTSIATSK